jgi:hypothetical protein
MGHWRNYDQKNVRGRKMVERDVAGNGKFCERVRKIAKSDY